MPRNRKSKDWKDRKKSSQSERPANDRTPEGADMPGANDISWYTRYPNLVVAAGNFPYPNRPGMSVELGTLKFGNSTVSQKVNIPGVMSLIWDPTIGHSELPTDPASILGKEMYSRVRKAYSGTLRADAPDYVMYVMALDSIFSYISWLKRLYRVLNVWSPDNYVLPDGVLYGMGLHDLDIQSLRANKTQLWQLINTLILESRKFSCPGSLDIINRHYWLNDNVYTDAQSINSQFYMFNQLHAYEFDPTLPGANDLSTSNPVGGLVVKPLPWARRKPITGEDPEVVNPTLTPQILYEFGRGLLDALVSWDDAYTINGYLNRAYEGEPQFIVEELPLDAVFAPMFNPEVLTQIENSMTVPGGIDTSWVDLSIYQNPLNNAIVCDPRSTVTTAQMNGDYMFSSDMNPFLSVRSDTPGALENVIASRLKASVRSAVPNTGEGASGYVFHYDFASEIPISWIVVGSGSKRDGTVPMWDVVKSEGLVQVKTRTTDATNVGVPLQWLLMSQFDWHPFGFNASTGNGTVYVYGDFHNVTAISREELNNLHRVCMFSEFNSFSMI